MQKSYKYKKWWWKFIRPIGMEVDLTVLKLSASNPVNERITERLKEEFRDKYLKKDLRKK